MKDSSVESDTSGISCTGSPDDCKLCDMIRQIFECFPKEVDPGCEIAMFQPVRAAVKQHKLTINTDVYLDILISCSCGFETEVQKADMPFDLEKMNAEISEHI